jgi:hypothetical protein
VAEFARTGVRGYRYDGHPGTKAGEDGDHRFQRGCGVHGDEGRAGDAGRESAGRCVQRLGRQAATVDGHRGRMVACRFPHAAPILVPFGNLGGSGVGINVKVDSK